MGRWDRRIESFANKELSYSQRRIVDGLAGHYASVSVCFGEEYVTIYGYEQPTQGSKPDVACNVDSDGTLEIIETDEARAGPTYLTQ